jgi:hypothetical protein
MFQSINSNIFLLIYCTLIILKKICQIYLETVIEIGKLIDH